MLVVSDDGQEGSGDTGGVLCFGLVAGMAPAVDRALSECRI